MHGAPLVCQLWDTSALLLSETVLSVQVRWRKWVLFGFSPLCGLTPGGVTEHLPSHDLACTDWYADNGVWVMSSFEGTEGVRLRVAPVSHYGNYQRMAVPVEGPVADSRNLVVRSVSFNRVAPNEALVVLFEESTLGRCIICILVDVAGSFSAGHLHVTSRTKLPFPTVCEITSDSVAIMGKAGSHVFIVKTFEEHSQVFALEESTATVTELHTCVCDGVSQVNEAMFCVYSCSTMFYEIWECRETTRRVHSLCLSQENPLEVSQCKVERGCLIALISISTIGGIEENIKVVPLKDPTQKSQSQQSAAKSDANAQPTSHHTKPSCNNC
ncbi:hypothetical protein Pelo_6645 [Pelomyxa schiedti]|nr:hypothetical protein Pelo_6645 [Pelomyxa schiedti]